MEKQHKDAINNNFDYLVSNCKSSLLLPKLKSKISMLPEEYDFLHSIKDSRQQCRELLTFLKSRGPTVFDALVNSLIETNQFTVLNKIEPGACNGSTIAAQQLEELKNKKVFIDPQCIYQPDDINLVNVESQERPLEVIVQRAKNFDYEQTEFEANNPLYNTTSNNRGLVKIINIVKVVGKKERSASDIDVRNLTSLFQQIGCNVDVYNHENRPTKENVLNAIREFVNDERLSDADMALLFIMSHGGQLDHKPYVCDCDAGMIFYDEIAEFFNNANCVRMQYKPKMIFIQACRGIMSDYGVRSVRVETDSHVIGGGDVTYMPTQTDLLLAYSTSAGFASHRDTVVGSWFIYLICEVFMKHAHDKDVESMLRIVYHYLHRERTTTGQMQTGEFTAKTFKKCYLNPGIYREDNQLCYF